MFTGIVEEIGVAKKATGKQLEIDAKKVLDDLSVGDSIAVDGVCLTITSIAGQAFTVDVMPETIQKTTIGWLRPHDKVNLERALPATGRFGGHFVTGHIDGIGLINDRTIDGNSIILTVTASKEVVTYLVKQGAVAIDGVSLTVQELGKEHFKIAITPYTAGVTTLGMKRQNSKVNVEVDTLGKYVKRFLNRRDEENKGLETLFRDVKEGG